MVIRGLFVPGEAMFFLFRKPFGERKKERNN